ASIGAGVALTLSELRNIAEVPATVAISAHGVELRAELAPDGGDDASTVAATASSGAAGKVSVAGSAAIALVDHVTRARVLGALTLLGGDLLLSATSALAGTVSALPVGAGSTASGSVGVGISFAFALVDDTTTTELGDGVAVTGARDVTLETAAASVVTATAKMGAAGGGVTITPAVALVLSNVAAGARIGTGALALTGSLRVASALDASAATDAGAEASGASTAAIGIGLALTIANHASTATLARNVNAGGGVALTASAVSASTATGAASAAGAPPEEPADSADGDGDGKTGVDETVGTQRDHADAVAGERGLADSGSTETPSAETSSGSVAVAAAIGIALSTVTARTDITSAVSSIQAGARVTLASALNAD